MGLKCLDGPLSIIVTVVVSRDKLEVYLPFLFHESLEFGTHVIFKYLKVDRESFGGQLLHYAIVCVKKKLSSRQVNQA